MKNKAISLALTVTALSSTLIALSSGLAGAATWTELGGIPGGSLARIVVDPSNPKTILVGADYGGLIYRSIDGGAHYTARQAGTVDEGFRAIAFDPANSKIVFAMGRDNVNGINSYVYKSANGGTSWSRLPHQPSSDDNLYGWGIVFDKTGTTILTADSHHGVFRSTDQGNSWTQVITGSVKAIAADPYNPKVFWAAGYDSQTGTMYLQKSSDVGKTWVKVTVPNPGANTFPAIYGIAFTDSKTILADWGGFDPKTGNDIGGVVASRDGGKTWTKSSTGLPTGEFFPGDTLLSDPQTPTTVYLSTGSINTDLSLYRSTDNGVHWAVVDNLFGSGIYTLGARPALKALPAAILAGGQDLFQSTDSGKSWVRSSDGITNATLVNAEDDQLSIGAIYASTYDGLFHSADAGQNWTRVSTWTGESAPVDFDVDTIAKIHPIYALTASGLWRSANAGKTWAAIALPKGATNLAHVVTDRSKAGQIYLYDTARTLYRSADSGKTWVTAKIGGPTATFSAYPTSVSFDAIKTGTIYAAMSTGVLKSINAGVSWTNTNVPGGKTSPVTALAISQKPDTSLVAWVGGKLQLSSNGAKTWKAGTAPSPDVYQISPQPESPNLFALADGEISESTSGGAAWTPIDTSISPTGVGYFAVTAGNLYLSSVIGKAWVRAVP